MDSAYFTELIQSQIIDKDVSDANAPFSYLEWKGRSPSLIEKNSQNQYNFYVLNWFSSHKHKPISKKFILRQKYLYLLDQLQLFFSDEEKNIWYRKVNLADEKELLLAIPYFAKKLKEISLYYLELRNKIKNTKVKYNTTGSVAGIEQEIYTYVLENFALSGKNTENSSIVWKNIPTFADLQKTLSVEIEELYDDKQYFDISQTQPLTEYFDFLHEATANFLATKGIVLSSADWLFDSFDVSADLDSFSNLFTNLTGALFEATEPSLYVDFIQKFIGENKYIISFVPEVTSTTSLIVPFSEGNNHFFYPYGATSGVYSSSNKRLPSRDINSLDFSSAIAGYTPSDSDTITVTYGNVTKTAWLRQIDYLDLPKTVETKVKKDSTTSFIFPYPGYGLSGVDLNWTGPSLVYNSEYDFLTKEQKTNVDTAYWSQATPIDSCDAVLLNNTTLVSSGATPDTDPRFADHFYQRNSRYTDITAPQGELQGAWLYKFLKTQLPVSTTSNNTFLWPYQRIDTETTFLDYLEDINFSEACNPIGIQDLVTPMFISDMDINTADRIFKLNKPDDNSSAAAECAWLSGSVTTLTNYTSSVTDGVTKFDQGGNNGYRFVNQDNFSGMFTAGVAVRFIWTGPNSSLDDVFKSVSHKSDCPFVTNFPTVKKFEWEKCTCKQIYHTPFGHAFDTFEEGNYLSDCIAEVTSDFNLLPFDIGSWRDSSGLSLTTSSNFAWYKTESDFTWGNGKWSTNSGAAPFTLMTGKSYVYLRANNKTKQTDLPFYVLNYNYGTNRSVWIEARRSADGEGWESTGRTSTMKLYPGDFVKVERQPQTIYEVLSAVFVENTAANTKSIWSTYDYVPIKCDEITQVNITWPTGAIPFGTMDPQYPPFTFSELSRVEAWAIQRIQDGEIHYYVNPTKGSNYNSPISTILTSPYLSGETLMGVALTGNFGTGTNNLFESVTFIAPTTGTYAIYLTATKVDGTKAYLNSTTIPPITCVGEYSDNSYVSISFSSPSCGFLIQEPLKGWNYNKVKYDTYAFGARPYWAILETDKSSTTRYKGIYAWGYPETYIDEYLPDTSPKLSPISISFNTIIDYNRKGKFFVWKQPINYKEYKNTSQWCEMSANFTQRSNLSSVYSLNEISPTVQISNDCVLSDIQLTNFINGDPVEVFYHAMVPFNLTVDYPVVEQSESATLSSYFISNTPWTNLTNRFNPTIANIPVLDQTYALSETGGYFLPQHLGASQFVNKDYNVFLKTGLLSGTFLTENPSIHIGGRGRTNQDQTTIFDWEENNEWIKESSTTGALAGAVKKSLTKTMQTFIPYQSNTDENTLGLITSQTKFTPWGGAGNNEWIDSAYDTKGFTGIRNVNTWTTAQIIKEDENNVESWTSDIYGNQYGLFKTPDSKTFLDRQEKGGKLWVKNNKQLTNPATIALSSVYDLFKGLTENNSYYELTNQQIQTVNCYYDTLFIKTPSAALFIPIIYNYETETIETTFDNVRWISLNDNVKFEKNWVFPAEKKVIILCTKFIKDPLGKAFYPCLYELDLITKNLSLLIQISPDKYEKFYSKDRLTSSLHFNKGYNAYLISYMGKNEQDKMFVLDYHINNESSTLLTKIVHYKEDSSPIKYPPVVTMPYLTSISVVADTTFNIIVPVLNTPLQYSLLNYKEVVNMTSTSPITSISFQGKVPIGLHNINYKLDNNVDSTLYSLTLHAS